MSKLHFTHGLIGYLLLLAVASLLRAATPVIAQLPPTLDATYDLRWQLTVTRPLSTPLVIQLETTHRLVIGNATVRWEAVGAPASPVRTAALTLVPGQTYSFAIKRRPGTLAVLCDHRLLLTAPLPQPPQGTLAVTAFPAGATIRDLGYQRIEPCLFGDDFMREESLEQFLARVRGEWVDDSGWEVAYFHKPAPGADPVDPQTKTRFSNPWEVNAYTNHAKSTNGFWLQYTGAGPSWVVPAASFSSPWWDRYAVQVAVRPDYDSTVGLLAAYQDPQNYILFRWQARDAVVPGNARAALVAMIAGQERVLATAPRGFDPEQWFTLRLQVSWQRLQAFIDGALLWDVPNPGPVEGGIGIYADGAAHPRRPSLDAATATMYVVKDNQGHDVNDAADALRPTSYLLFDDVQVTPWETVEDLSASPYAVEQTGRWQRGAEGQLTSLTAGRWMIGIPESGPTVFTTQVQLPRQGTAGVLLCTADGQDGYVWALSATDQQLFRYQQGHWGALLTRTTRTLSPGVWVTVRVEVDGPYFACFLDGERLCDQYDPAYPITRYGLLGSTSGIPFRRATLFPLSPRWQTARIHAGFAEDKWLMTWASADADWIPAVWPTTSLTALGTDRDQEHIGAAAPPPSSLPGRYWHKGGFYHDVRIRIPLTPQVIAGQEIALSPGDAVAQGYRWQFTHEGDGALVRCWRQDTLLGTYPCSLTAHSRIVIERLGTWMILRVEEVDPEDAADDPTVERETLLCAYHDPQPLPAERVSLVVTSPALPAAAVQVTADRVQDAFEQAPVGWTTQSGIWKVMPRYSCQPEWNWFGGFGAGAPTAWSKWRLDGDQDVEVYLGVKMQYDQMREGEEQRFRDLNLTICADGAHLNSGYSLIRAGRLQGQPTTMLLRRGVIVKTSTDPAHVLPSGSTGHRQWFATRLVKRGAEIAVYLDNRLAFTYVDPDPLPGGYAAVWSRENGIMLGRANLSAARMTLGRPQAARPLAVQAELPPLPVPPVTVNNQPVTLATFETGCEGWQEEPGLTARLLRERTVDPINGPHTFLSVITTYPAGDAAVRLSKGPCDLAVTPIWSADYCADPGARLQLYLRCQGQWYAIALLGPAVADAQAMLAGRLPLQADGRWHHVTADLGQLLSAAVTALRGTPPTALVVDAMVLADWSTPADLRAYGFGAMPGGTVMRWDNVVWLPRVTGPATVRWTGIPGYPTWQLAIDGQPMTGPQSPSTETTVTGVPTKEPQYLHLRGCDVAGAPGGCVHLPLTGISGDRPAQP